MHGLLLRQLKRAGIDPGSPPEDKEAWATFLERVSRSYDDHDRTLYRNQRSLEIASAEMQDLYDELRRASASQIGRERDRLRAVMDSLDDGVCVLTNDCRVKLVNATASTYLGQAEAGLVGQRILPRFNFEYFDATGTRQTNPMLLNQVAIGLTISGIPGVLTRMRDDDLPVSCTLAPLRPHDPDTDIVLVFRDETQRLGVQAALKRSEYHYANLVRRAPIAIWEEDFTGLGEWLDMRRREGIADIGAYLMDHPEELARAISTICVLDANVAALTLIGASSKEEVLGPIEGSNRLTRHKAQSWIDEIVAVWEGRDWLTKEVMDTRLDGSAYEAVVNWSAPRVGGRLDLAHVIVTVVDISESKEAERQMRALIKSKDQFLASISHELRTPLTAVHTSAAVLEEQFAQLSHEERLELIGYITRESQDMSHIVEDLLVGARADIGKLTVLPRRIDLRGECETVIRRLTATHDEARAVDGSVISGIAMADPLRFRQILRNLLTNAFRYGGDRVWLEEDKEFDRVRIRVCDGGPGIPSDQQAAVFEPYHRSQSDPGLPGSVGMGLAVARTLADLMKGSLDYRYEPSRSIFELTLPLD